MNEYERKASVLPKTLESSEGSNGVPELKLITSGERAGSSLNFYLQIDNTVYKYHVLQGCTTLDKITLKCVQDRKNIPAEKRCQHDIYAGMPFVEPVITRMQRGLELALTSEKRRYLLDYESERKSSSRTKKVL
jgi:hypothetical protein